MSRAATNVQRLFGILRHSGNLDWDCAACVVYLLSFCDFIPSLSEEVAATRVRSCCIRTSLDLGHEFTFLGLPSQKSAANHGVCFPTVLPIVYNVLQFNLSIV